ncbi:MAG TPA: hypothetical protein VIW80_04425 [Pyrinomonadaceae bacterium]
MFLTRLGPLLARSMTRCSTRGVFKGTAESELSVAVQVKPPDEPVSEEEMKTMAAISQMHTDQERAQQQQQQQQ